MHGVLWISVAVVILHRPQIDARVGKVVAARVPQHVRMNFERCPLPASRSR